MLACASMTVALDRHALDYRIIRTSRNMSLLRAVLSVVVLGLTVGAASAQSFPTKPVRIVVGFPPGGGIDLVARLLAPKLSESLGQQVLVDNRAGANGIIAAELVAKAPADGHTMFIGTTGNLSVNPALY